MGNMEPLDVKMKANGETRIKELREKQNMSQQRLAELSGISRGTISALETGETRIAYLKTFRAIAKALGVRVSELFYN